VLRIGLGVAVLADLAVRASDLHAFYTDGGVLSRSDALALFGWLHAWPPCIHMAGGSFWSQVLFLLLAATAAAALVVGWRTRLATAVTWLLTMSVQLRDPFVGAGYDQLLRMLLFWGCFLPLGARMSVDAIRQPARTNAWLSVGGTVAPWCRWSSFTPAPASPNGSSPPGTTGARCLHPRRRFSA
jgi:hypothetical protein